MDKLAVERRRNTPKLWNNLAWTIAEWIGVQLIGRPRLGAVTITLPNGRSRISGDPATGQHPILHINNFGVLTKTLRRGTVGFAQSFMDGDLEVEDLTTLFRYFLQNRAVFTAPKKSRFRSAAEDFAYHMSRPNTKQGAKENISEHYDLGNAFYTEWLDPTMTYSSAYYAYEDQSLEDAQKTKYRRVADMAGIKPGARVLEIGCGWGGFAETVAREYDAELYGITLSREQLAYGEARLHRQGLDNLATLHFEDYRDTKGQFDHVASIEMIEAVGEEHWPTYFKAVHDRLKPGGTAAIQAITMGEAEFEHYRSGPDFIQRYIFPGGMLLTKAAMQAEGARVGLILENVDTFRMSYARTLKLWRERFLERWSDIAKLGFDEHFRRKWIYYLAYCEAGFTEDSIDVGIYQYRRPE